MNSVWWKPQLQLLNVENLGHYQRESGGAWKKELCNPSWCWHRRAEENGETPESHSTHAGNFLSKDVGQKLLPVYHRMSSDSLLQRMQHEVLLSVAGVVIAA
ncbi:unnamed protein product [Gadus morhua 'NCC']